MPSTGPSFSSLRGGSVTGPRRRWNVASGPVDADGPAAGGSAECVLRKVCYLRHGRQRPGLVGHQGLGRRGTTPPLRRSLVAARICTGTRREAPVGVSRFSRVRSVRIGACRSSSSRARSAALVAVAGMGAAGRARQGPSRSSPMPLRRGGVLLEALRRARAGARRGQADRDRRHDRDRARREDCKTKYGRACWRRRASRSA